MKYTYELSRIAKSLMAGDKSAFRGFYDLSVHDTVFHVHMITRDERETERLMVQIYAQLYKSTFMIEKAEDIIDWLNDAIYTKCAAWLNIRNLDFIIEEDNGCYSIVDGSNDFVYGDTILTEAEMVKLMEEYVARLSQVHMATALAYFYDNLPMEKITEIFGCDAMKVTNRANYAKKLVEKQCREYAKNEKLEIRLIDPPMMMMAFVGLSKKYWVSNVNALYDRIVEACGRNYMS